MRAALLVTHLLGTGHLRRAALIADAFVAAGHEALVISGGRAAPLAEPRVARLERLPALRTPPDFSVLLDAEGAPATPALLAERRARIAAALRGFDPDVLVCELWPFGRRRLAAEFESALDAVPRARKICSVRDILQHPRKPGRAEAAEATFAARFDFGVVHGDPSFLKLSASWPMDEGRWRYTGYVDEGANPPPRPLRGTASPPKRGEGETQTLRPALALSPPAGGGLGGGPVEPSAILVAAGGGAAGAPLFAAAARAADAGWTLLGAPDMPMRGRVEPLSPAFRARLAACDAAVVQCGYNTAMDLLAARARALLVPFEGEGEAEQLIRATAMAARFGYPVLRERDLSAAALREGVEAARAMPRPPPDALDRGVAARTVMLCEAS